MSVQIFVQARIFGIEQFLLSAPAPSSPSDAPFQERLLAGRSHYVSLISEVLPRALLRELGLSNILLGASGGEQFLVVLPSESREAAEQFLAGAAIQMAELSNGALQLLWAVTENLGDWSDVRKRLNEAMQRKRGTPAAAGDAAMFAPFAPAQPADFDAYFAQELGARLRTADAVGWVPETPGRVLLSGGKHMFPLSSNASDALPIARHAAPDNDDYGPATARTLGERSHGRPAWGVLRGDVDSFAVQLRRAQTIEEHIQLSVLYKQFFAGELEVLCSMPEYWRRVTVLYSGGDDFAVYGSWDALIALAREVQRLFQRLTELNLKDLPGREGKTLTMALALASSEDASLCSVYEEAGENLELAKSTDKDCCYVLGRVLEWQQLTQAAELKDDLVRLVSEFGYGAAMLDELVSYYREPATARRRGGRLERPWRFYRRMSILLGSTRDRELAKLRSSLMTDLIGKNAAQAKLRPSGRVALEWAAMEGTRANGGDTREIARTA